MSRNNGQDHSTMTTQPIANASSAGTASITSSPGAFHYKRTPSNSINYSAAEWVSKMGQISIPKGDLNELIMNYLIIEGYSDAVRIFSEESKQKIDDLVLKDVEFREKLRNLVLDGKIKETISLINDSYPMLLEENNVLLFALKKQHLIELIKENRSKEAVYFAQKDLVPLTDMKDHLMSELEDAMALLAYTGNKRKSKKQEPTIPAEISHLLDQEHREKLVKLLNSKILEAGGLVQPEPKVNNLIRLMFWAQSLLDEYGATYPHIDHLLDVGTKEQ
ncbi:Glucose-induced degradation complex subunit [Mitosporidium daphniae]